MPLPEQFFVPSSVAVIGASKEPDKIGYFILENLKMTFKGEIYPINPTADQILGLTAYASVLDIEGPVELAVIAVPADIVPSVLQDCVKKKVKAAVIVSSGFSEAGKKDKQEELYKIAKGKTRLIGPNCLGTYSRDMDMLFLPRARFKRPPEGSIGLISQSGGLGAALIDSIGHEGVGVSKFASYGNAIDVDETDLLEYFAKDLGTRCITLYIENIRDGRRFLDVASKITRTKPIVALKGGKTIPGARAVETHIGKSTGPSEIYSAAFKQAGIIEVSSTEELFDFAKALSSQPALKGNKIAVITDAGGFGIIAADTAAKAGLELAEFSKDTMKAVKSSLPDYGVAENPLDMTTDSNTERYEKVIGAVFKDKNVSGVVLITLFQLPFLEDAVIDVLRDAKIHGKPVVVCTTGGEYTISKARKLESYGVPVYPTPVRALNALKALYTYGSMIKK